MPIIDPKYLKFLQAIFKRNTKNADHEALISSMVNELEQIQTSADDVKTELMLSSSEGDWLEDWGAWFGVSRLTGETDDHLRYRILTNMEDKVSIPAIIDGIKKMLNLDSDGYDQHGNLVSISIYEPFNEVRMFNVSTFSGKGRYEDKDYYRIGVVHVTIKGLVESPQEVIDFAKRTVSAGIRLYIDFELPD